MGYFLIQGVRDPLGGVNSLWPLFGIANQMLAAIGLCLGTTIILKMTLRPEANGEGCRQRSIERGGRWAPALITLLPLTWLLAVTVTAGVQKIAHPDPRIGFLAQAKALAEQWPSLQLAVTAAKAAGDAAAIGQAEQALRKNEVLRFNNQLDAAVAVGFLLMVSAIVLLSGREWVLLLRRRKPALLCETEPVWLPDYAVAEVRAPVHLAGLAALAFALTKELSGEAEIERARQFAALSECGREEQCSAVEWQEKHSRNAGARAYLDVAEKRFKGIKHCC